MSELGLCVTERSAEFPEERERRERRERVK